MSGPDGGPPGVATISPETLKQSFERGDRLLVLDVREAHERAIATIPLPPSARGLAIPTGEVPLRLDEITDAARGVPLVVYCHLGVRSRAVATWLVRQGLTEVADLEGGIEAWSRRVAPEVPRY